MWMVKHDSVPKRHGDVAVSTATSQPHPQVLGLIRGLAEVLFCVEFAHSLLACLGSLRVLRFPSTIRSSQLATLNCPET